MRKNKLITINRPRLYPNGDSTVQDITDIAKMFTPKQENSHLISRRDLRGYDLGGALELANTAASQVATVAGNIIDVNNRAKAVEEDLKGQVTNPTPSSSTDELLNKWSSWKPTTHITWKDLTNKGSALSYAADMLSMSSQGAAAGSSLSPWGAIGGGIGGLVSGLFNNLGSQIRAKKKAKDINRMIDTQNLSTQRAFTNQAGQLDEEITARDLADFTGWGAAYGGPLHYAFGGNLMTHGADFPTGITLIGNGGSHEENPLEGVPMGIDNEGIPNLVEEGEVIFNDYVFSKRLKVPETVKKKYKLRGTKPLTFADAAIQMSKESEERPNDPISQRGLEDSMLKLMVAQEQLRAKRGDTNTFANGGLVRKFGTGSTLPIIEEDPDDSTKLPRLVPLSEIKEPKIDAPKASTTSIRPPLSVIALRNKGKSENKGENIDLLRFASAIGQGIQTLTDALGLTNSPDFTLGKRIREANKQVRGIGTRAAGQRIGYKPIDEWTAINNFNAQMAAQRSALRNSGNRVGAAGQLLASAYNQNRALGELYAGMERENWNRLTQAITHNTSIDQANRAAELQAAQADAAQGNIRAQNLITAAKADDMEETAYAQARAANRDNFLNTLGAIGKEKIDREMMRGLIESGVFGTPNETLLKALQRAGYAANGGKINRKKKRGLTY